MSQEFDKREKAQQSDPRVRPLIGPLLLCIVCCSGLCFGQGARVHKLTAVIRATGDLPIPGATCTLACNSEPNSAVVSLSDDAGLAPFANLLPGTYTLTVTKSGFETLTRGNIVIKDELDSKIEVVLTIVSVQEKVIVAAPSAAAASVAAGATTPSGNLERAAMQTLPLATARIDQALPLIPGVIRSAQGELSIKGASEQQSALLINGANANDPATGSFRLNLPIDSVEAVQVFLHPYTGEYGKFVGGVTRIETRGGADKWHFELNDFLPDMRIKGGKILGVAEDSPRLNVNGPLVHDRLFFSQTATYTIAKQSVRGLTFPDNETKTEGQSYFSQLDLILSEHHAESFTIGYFPVRDRYVGLDFFTPKDVTPNYRQRDYSFTACDRYEFNNGLLESMFSARRFDANVWGQGGAPQVFTPIVELGNYFATLDRRSLRLEALEIYTTPKFNWLGGSHEIKTGVDFNYVADELRFGAHPVRLLRADASLAELIEFGLRPARRIPAHNNEYSGFLQDRVLLGHNFTIDLGLRFEDQRIAHEDNLAPRVGFAWSPDGSDRTVFRGGIGMFYDKVPLNIRGFNRYPQRTVTTYADDGTTVISRVHFDNVLVSAKPIGPVDFRHTDRDGGFVPLNVTWNVQLDQKITRSIALRANYINSRTNNIYVVNPEPDYLGTSAIVLRSTGNASYRAMELTSRFNLKKDEAIYVSYVRSRSRGDLNDFNSYFGDWSNPILRQNQYSNLPFDVPNRLVAWGKIGLPERASISPIVEWRSGFPFSVRDEQQNFVGLRNSDQTRFPNFFSVDLELAKEIQLTKKYGVRLSVTGFNITNHFNPRDVHANVADPQFRSFFAPYHRYFTGGFDVLF